METQIAILLAFTSIALMGNAIFIWFAYRAFADMAARLTATMQEIESSQTARGSLKALEAASIEMVAATDSAKRRIALFEPSLARAESQWGYTLAKVDVRMERVCGAVRDAAQNAQTAVERPADWIGGAASGIQQVLKVMLDLENDGDASARRNR